MKPLLSRLILEYFKFLAKIQLKKNQSLIIGITGSAGKSSARNAVEAIFKDHFRTKTGYKANSESGIPLNILGLSNKNYSRLEWLYLILAAPIKLFTNKEKYDVYIVEMAIDSPDAPKNMAYLLTILQPRVGIFLNAGAAHSQPFDNLVKTIDPRQRKEEVTALIAAEKGKLITSLPENGTAILNADDANVMKHAEKTQATVLTFGQTKNATIRVVGASQKLSGTSFSLKYQNKNYELKFPSQALPEHFGYTLAAALAAAISQNITVEKAIKSLQKNFKLPKGRSSLIPAINGAYILDSSYNASAEPMLDSLELINQIAPGKKLALLGDMRELGQETKLEHERVAKKAAAVCDKIALVGPAMRQYALPVIATTNTPAQWFPDAAKAAIYLEKQLEKDSLLLVKGSQNTLLLEIAVEKLMQEPEKADELLCRRGAYWDQQRAKLLR